ncbi:hypothetical protein PQO03_15640 [Lentisphaera profundi]|uniref:PsrA tetracyclin repressor-like C-terminal domain-containing protein n=1 Tax=Lentisphaera profundi TaxID=1658616 RepID=A0ABY7W4U8_9BACT|nr:hypothetical protein [Lentisphaera profundi]WDE99268.1 hypothetical protein PQO03_15640 [Lentisphaera profundi]
MPDILSLDLRQALDELTRLETSELKVLILDAAAEAIQLNESQSDGERLNYLLEILVQSLLYYGEAVLDKINLLDGDDRQLLFNEWNKKTKDFVKYIRMPHDFEDTLNQVDPSLLWDWAIIAAQSFVGANPSIEMNPEHAEDRRVEAFDLMMRILARILNSP